MTAFFVEGLPAPQGSKTGFIRGGRVILKESSDKVKPWREAVSKVADGVLMDGPIHVEMVFVMPRTKAMGDKEAPLMIQRPDIDKLTRSTFDGLTGTAYHDDSQVVSMTVIKRRAEPGEPTGAHIKLSPASVGLLRRLISWAFKL